MFSTIQEAAIWDNRLRELRKEHKLTLTQLIEKMGTYMTTYVRYEPGKRVLPENRRLLRGERGLPARPDRRPGTLSSPQKKTAVIETPCQGTTWMPAGSRPYDGSGIAEWYTFSGAAGRVFYNKKGSRLRRDPFFIIVTG